MEYTELKPGMYINLAGQPYGVVSSEFLRMQQRKPVVKTKLKNLFSGAISEKNFQPSDEIEEAEIERIPVKFLYSKRDEFWFSDEQNNRFSIKEDILGNAIQFLKDGIEAIALKFSAKGGSVSGGEGKIFNVEIPIKIDFKVIEAPPSIKGNTAQGGTKAVTIETGTKVNTPMFVEEGDVIKVNTLTGEYVERVEKSK